MASVTCVAIQPYFTLSIKEHRIEVERCEPIPVHAKVNHIDTPMVSLRQNPQQTSMPNASDSTRHSRSAPHSNVNRTKAQDQSSHDPSREALLKLYRESCELFPKPQKRSAPQTHPAGDTHHNPPSTSVVGCQPTVTEWTSPATRREEYKKIDRANRGMRGFLRRVIPHSLQPPPSRTPFFEEKGKPTDREGSVRRFRRDVPGEPKSTQRGARPRWLFPRTTTSPP